MKFIHRKLLLHPQYNNVTCGGMTPHENDINFITFPACFMAEK